MTNAAALLLQSSLASPRTLSRLMLAGFRIKSGMTKFFVWPADKPCQRVGRLVTGLVLALACSALFAGSASARVLTEIPQNFRGFWLPMNTQCGIESPNRYEVQPRAINEFEVDTYVRRILLNRQHLIVIVDEGFEGGLHRRTIKFDPGSNPNHIRIDGQAYHRCRNPFDR